jgi:hypothetical protein
MNRQPDSTIPLTQSNLINLFYLSSTSLKSNIHKHLLKNVCSITEDEIRIDELSLHFDPFTFNGSCDAEFMNMQFNEYSSDRGYIHEY